MRTRSLITTAVAATGLVLPVTEAKPLCGSQIEQDMSYKGYILLSALITYVTFKILKKLYNTFILYRFHIPVHGNPSNTKRTQLYIQLFTPRDQCLLHIARIPIMVKNYKLEIPEDKAIPLDFHMYWLTSHIQVDWQDIHFQIDKSLINLPVVISVPIHKTLKIKRMFWSSLKMRLLLFTDFYYCISDPVECTTMARNNDINVQTDQI